MSKRCDHWFHAGCVGLTEEQVGLVDTFFCSDCEKSEWIQQSEDGHVLFQSGMRLCDELTYVQLWDSAVP